MNINNLTESKLQSYSKNIIVEKSVNEINGETTIIRYLVGKLLRKNAIAKYYEFTNLQDNKMYLAKVISKANIQKSRTRNKLKTEIKIHKSLNHNNIIFFIRCFEDNENIYILFEYCNYTINDILKHRKTFSEEEVKIYLLQLLSALKYLRANKIIHRDLKLSHLFINEKNELKLGEFGLATKLEFEGERKKTVCGTSNFIAPEILYDKSGYSYEVDVWSLGIVCYSLIIGKSPFELNDFSTIKTTYKNIKENKYSFPKESFISENAKSLINELLNSDPNKRPSLDQVSEHDFFHIGVNNISKIDSSSA